MLSDRPIPLLDLVVSISNATDLVDKKLNDHNKRVAFNALNIAEAIGLPNEDKYQIIIAGLLHDIGAFSLKERMEILKYEPRLKDFNMNHAIIGSELLKMFTPFEEISTAIRYHHHKWKDIKRKKIPAKIKTISQILFISDRIDVLLDKEKPVLKQVAKINKRIEKDAGEKYNSSILEVVRDLGKKEYFWFDAVSKPEADAFTDKLGSIPIDFRMDSLYQFARLFRTIIDFRSPFTATHSSGVTATAETIARVMGFSETESAMMRVAGYFHDLGKLSVPTSILNKPSGLNSEEVKIIRGHTYYTYKILEKITNLEIITGWAAFHHETLDGNGYPFHLKAEQLSLGSRIMAVSDIFTAITEDRPYRKGLDRKESLEILIEMAANNKIDKNVVEAMRSNFDEVNQAREDAERKASAEYDKFRKYLNGLKN